MAPNTPDEDLEETYSPPATMTVPEAAKVWLECKTEIDALKPRLEEAAEVLKNHFRRTGKSRFRNLISYALTTYRKVDTKAMRAAHPDLVDAFTELGEREQLSPLR